MRGKPVFCLPGSWIPLLFLNEEGCDCSIASNSGMNEFPGYFWLGGGGMEHGSESGMLNFTLHSQTSLVSEEGVTYSQVSVVISLCFSRYSIFFFCIIIKLWQCFWGNRSSLWFIYLFSYKWKNGSFMWSPLCDWKASSNTVQFTEL
jgi:hypothetical protein